VIDIGNKLAGYAQQGAVSAGGQAKPAAITAIFIQVDNYGFLFYGQGSPS
jgi:hypothetical protein